MKTKIKKTIAFFLVFSACGQVEYTPADMAGDYELQSTDCQVDFFGDKITVNQFVRIWEEQDGQESIGIIPDSDDYSVAGGKIADDGEFYFENEVVQCRGFFDNNENGFFADCYFGDQFSEQCFVEFGLIINNI